MKRMIRLLSVLMAAALGAACLSQPAQAAVWTSSISFNASPEPVAAGGYVTLSGTAGFTKSGNEGVVRFYFRRANATAFTYIAAAKTMSNGAFSARTRQTTSGHWKAVYAGNAIRKPVTSVVDYVEAKAWRDVVRTRFKRSDTGNYTGPVASWATDRSATMSAKVTCAEPSPYNFFNVYWTGKPVWGSSAVELAFKGGASATGTRYLYPDEKTGYIEIATQDDCTWTVTITQTIRAYVVV
jgi:hypothetical protein